MDKYELEEFLKNLKYKNKAYVKSLIKDGTLTIDNIVDILFNWVKKLEKIKWLTYAFEDLDFQYEDED